MEGAPFPKLPKKLNAIKSVWDFDEEEIARQLSLVSMGLFSRIKLDEFLDQKWSKPKLQSKATNLIGFINRFNQVANWVIGSIVECDRIKERVKRMEKVIRMAHV